MPRWYLIALRRSAAARLCVGWARETYWPGFQDVSLRDSLVFLINESLRNDITFRSYAIAYTFFISLFPAVLVIFTLIPYLPLYDTIDAAVGTYLADVLPGEAGQIAYEFIRDVSTRQQGGLLSVSFLLAFYFSSNGMMAMMNSFEKTYELTYRERKVVRKRLVAIALTLSFGALLVASVLIITIGTAALNLVQRAYDLGDGYQLSLRLVQWLAITSLLYSAVAITYRYGSATLTRIRFFSPGATLATVLSILTSVGFAIYIENFNSYNKLYGSIGTIIIFMLWLQLNILWILIGYELNASIAVNRDLRVAPVDTDAV